MAIAAEAGGLSLLWVIDRLLVPVNPRSAYPTSADGTLPPEQRTAIDPEDPRHVVVGEVVGR